MSNQNLKTLLEIVDTYKKELTDATYIKICQDLKQRFENSPTSNSLITPLVPLVPLLIEDKINPSFSPLYQYLILCVLEQRGSNSISGIDTTHQQETKSQQQQDHRQLLLNYIESISDRFYFLNRMKSDIATLTTNQTRDCQTCQTGNHYSRLVFKTYHKDSNTFYNLSFTAKFKQETSPHNLLGDLNITISYTTDIVVNKNTNPRPYTNHTIGIDKDTCYHRTNIYTTSVYQNDHKITSLPAQYLISEIQSPDYVIDIKTTGDTCIIS